MATKKEEVFEIIGGFCTINDQIKSNLEKFVNSLLNYNEKYNLIGKSTIEDIWLRHVLDSAQLIKFINNKNIQLADFGSGAGLPGIILSILGVSEVHLIEKSYRKCQFLELAKQFSNNKIIIHQSKIEDLKNLKYDVITSRALSPLDKLLKQIKPFIKDNSIGIFPKGKNLKNELNLILDKDNLSFKMHDSLTSDEGNILIINFSK
jgi:16S rRNA (guanine527-N7)-methyltransferase